MGIVTSKKGRSRPNSDGHANASRVIFMALLQDFLPIGAVELVENATREPFKSRAPAVCVAGALLIGKP